MSQLTVIPEYNKTALALADLRARLQSVVYDVSTGKGMEAARKDVAELRGLWVALEAERVRIKAPALERSRQIDAEAKTLEAELKGLAEPIKAQITAEETRKAREAEAKAQAERERMEAINAKFQALRGLPLNANGKPIPEIEALLEQAEAFDVDALPEDMKPAGVYEKRLAITALRAAVDARRAYDSEQADIAERLRKLEVLEREQKEREAEAARVAAKAAEEAEAARLEAIREAEKAERAAEAARKAEREAADKAAAEARAAADRAAQVERERLAAIAKAEADRIAAERVQFEADKAAAAAEAERREIAEASLVEAATEGLAVLKRLAPNDKATKKLAAALARE